MPKPFCQAEVDPKSALKTLHKLASYGFGDAEFALVHHWGAGGKLTVFKDYCERQIKREGLFRPGDNNHLLHLRLLRILNRRNELLPGRENFKSFAEDALKTHPPVEKRVR
jgi:hypothetical protein